MGSETIIALDLGKFKSVACVMDARTREHRFATVETTPAAHADERVAVGVGPRRGLGLHLFRGRRAGDGRGSRLRGQMLIVGGA